LCLLHQENPISCHIAIVDTHSFIIHGKKCTTFSHLEIQLFLYEEGYDGWDERYQIWLKMYHPGAENLDDVSLNESVFHALSKAQKCTQITVVSKLTSNIDKLFSLPALPSKLPT